MPVVAGKVQVATASGYEIVSLLWREGKEASNISIVMMVQHEIERQTAIQGGRITKQDKRKNKKQTCMVSPSSGVGPRPSLSLRQVRFRATAMLCYDEHHFHRCSWRVVLSAQRGKEGGRNCRPTKIRGGRQRQVIPLALASRLPDRHRNSEPPRVGNSTSRFRKAGHPLFTSSFPLSSSSFPLRTFAFSPAPISNDDYWRCRFRRAYRILCASAYVSMLRRRIIFMIRPAADRRLYPVISEHCDFSR